MVNQITTWLRTGSERCWERTGVLFGFLACTSIGIQLVNEWRSDLPSSLSLYFVLGFVLVYSFWVLYGIRFNHLGVWLPNAVATALQLILAGVVMFENVA